MRLTGRGTSHPRAFPLPSLQYGSVLNGSPEVVQERHHLGKSLDCELLVREPHLPVGNLVATLQQLRI